MSSLQAKLQQWLEPLDGLKVECDGMARIIDWLLTREGIEHRIIVGQLVEDHKTLAPVHYWTTLCDEHGVWHVIDLRARMWAGKQARHGVFLLHEDAPVQYRATGYVPGYQPVMSAGLIHACFDLDIEAYPRLNGEQQA